MRSDADDIVLAYLLAHDRHEHPPSIAGRFVRDELEARMHQGAALHWPSRSTREPSGSYEALVWIVKPVPEQSMCVMRELVLGIGEIWDRPIVDGETGRVLYYEPTTLRPKLPVISERLGMPVSVVRACIQDARVTVTERAARIGWR